MKNLLNYIRGLGKQRKIEELEQIIELERAYKTDLQKENEAMYKSIQILEQTISDMDRRFELANASIEELEAQVDHYEEINKELEKELIKAKERIEELNSDHYRIHKVPQGRIPNTQKTKVKSSKITSKIIKNIKEV